MSDKHVSEKATSKVSYDEIADKEMSSASNALFDEFSQGAKQLFNGVMRIAERMHDNEAANLATFLGESAAEQHTKNLEKEAARALKRGDLAGAKHFLKRDIAFTSWTQSLDDEDTQRLMKELDVIQKAEKQKEQEKAAERKSAKPSKASQSMAHLADVILAGA